MRGRESRRSLGSLILDSGATDHIFTEREHFVEYTPTLSTQRAFITTTDGSSHKVAGTGFVHIRVRNGETFFVQPLNSIHVPTFSCTLVSTSCLVKRGGLSFLQLPTGPELKKGNVKWADVVEQPSGLTLLAATIIMPGSHNTTTNLSTGMIWHHKLGHPGADVMSDFVRRGDIPKLSPDELAEVKGCQVCCQGKMSQLSHAKASEDLGTCPKMGCIHLDLIGPLYVRSANGAFTYAQTGIEVSTRLSFVSLLKTKDEALNRAKVTIQLLEVQSGLPLHSIRTDKGGEYVSQD